ncbi:MAG: hypothetical protein ACRC80_07490 [Waterburya sp.]
MKSQEFAKLFQNQNLEAEHLILVAIAFLMYGDRKAIALITHQFIIKVLKNGLNLFLLA